MPESFLYERLDAASSMGFLKKEVPDSVAQNLNPKYELRPYQAEAFTRFSTAAKTTFPTKPILCISCSIWQRGAAKRSSWRG